MTSKEAFYKFICNVDSNKPTIIIGLQDAAVIKELVERDTPVTPVMGPDQKGKIVLVCPSCSLDVVLRENFCSHCGQRLDWRTTSET